MSFELAVHRKAIDIGKLSVEMTTSAGSGHPSTALSLAHLVTVLMYHQMRWEPADPWNLANDRLVLSEGHAAPIIYPAYADVGGVVGPRDFLQPQQDAHHHLHLHLARAAIADKGELDLQRGVFGYL